MLRTLTLGAVAAGGVVAAGCTTVDAPWDAQRVQGDAIAVEFRPSIDRFTYIGPVDKNGPNLVFVQHQHQKPAANEAYTFYGGCYTWIAPQAGPLGWRDATGAERAWPPDPAMDVGPATVERIGAEGFRITTPIGRTGLREIKELRIEGPSAAVLEFTVQNTTTGLVTAGPWVNTAVVPGSVIAVRMTPATDVWGWNEESIARFRSVMRFIDGTGWAIVEPDSAEWEGGIKVYLDAAPEIAIWREGYWLHRVQTARDDGRLRRVGEGPVALYIQPAQGAEVAIVEAELYGRIADIPPMGSHAGTERWTVIPSATPDVSALPRVR